MEERKKLSEQQRHTYDSMETGVLYLIKQDLMLMTRESAIERLSITIDDLWKAADELHTGDMNELDITGAIFWLQSVLVEMRKV